jgi:hypothetical protein
MSGITVNGQGKAWSMGMDRVMHELIARNGQGKARSMGMDRVTHE